MWFYAFLCATYTLAYWFFINDFYYFNSSNGNHGIVYCDCEWRFRMTVDSLTFKRTRVCNRRSPHLHNCCAPIPNSTPAAGFWFGASHFLNSHRCGFGTRVSSFYVRLLKAGRIVLVPTRLFRRRKVLLLLGVALAQPWTRRKWATSASANLLLVGAFGLAKSPIAKQRNFVVGWRLFSSRYNQIQFSFEIK